MDRRAVLAISEQGGHSGVQSRGFGAEQLRQSYPRAARVIARLG